MDLIKALEKGWVEMDLPYGRGWYETHRRDGKVGYCAIGAISKVTGIQTGALANLIGSDVFNGIVDRSDKAGSKNRALRSIRHYLKKVEKANAL